jgi:hypothetical protein
MDENNNFNENNNPTENTQTPPKTYETYSGNTYSSQYTSTSQEPVPKGFAIVSLVLGIGGILTSCCCGLGSVFCIMGIIFGCIQEKGPDGTKPPQATAGIIASIVGLCLSILFFVYLIIFGLVGSEV